MRKIGSGNIGATNVLRTGRMTPGQQRAFDENWARWGLEHESGPLEFDTAFGRPGPRVLEIGFGMGQSLVAMAAAVWSAAPDQLLAMPARFLLRFFDNHGWLTLDGAHRWWTVKGGSIDVGIACGIELMSHVGLGANVINGKVTYEGVSEAFDLPYVDIDELL